MPDEIIISSSINLSSGKLLIEGKGSKERRLQIGNGDVIKILKEYRQVYADRIKKSGYFFLGPSGTAISDQSVRRMIKKYVNQAAIEMKITFCRTLSHQHLFHKRIH